MRNAAWIGVLLLALALAGAALASGFARTYPLGDGTVAITNSQANSVWAPVSVMIRFAEPSSGTASVWRASQGYSFQLGEARFTNATTIVWTPPAVYPFEYGDALVIECSATNGVVQALLRGG